MKIYAHRGSSVIWPENTLFAFEQAHEHGAAGFETDLRLSKDGTIVLSHDDNLARLGHPESTVSQLAASDIQEIEVASPDNRFKDTMITLEMLLRRFPEKDYIFDCKFSSDQLMETLKELLSEINFSHQVWFLTWSKAADRLVKRHFPAYPCFPRMSTSTGWGLASVLGLGNLLKPRHRILSLPAYYKGLPVFKKSQVISAQQVGKEFVGYLVNTRKDFGRCQVCGVRTVLTDRPDLISQLSAQKVAAEGTPQKAE